MDTNSLNNFIEDRFQENYSLLLDNANYIDLSKNYNAEYKNLEKAISSEDMKLVDKLIDSKNYLFSKELYLAYKIGFADGFHFSDDIKL